MKKQCTAHIECGNDGFYSVYVEEDFPFGFFGEGRTVKEAKQDFLGTFGPSAKTISNALAKMLRQRLDLFTMLRPFYNITRVF